MGKHSFLSASASHRWINCPPSARLCEEYADRPSEYAQEGTDCHELCAYKVEKALGRRVKDPTENLTYYSQEMEDCADGYCAFVMEEVAKARERCADPLVLVEQRLDYSRYVGIEGSFGTGDCVIVSDGLLHIIDYKHGLGVLVSAEKNSQLSCYALGAFDLFDTQTRHTVNQHIIISVFHFIQIVFQRQFPAHGIDKHNFQSCKFNVRRDQINAFLMV